MITLLVLMSDDITQLVLMSDDITQLVLMSDDITLLVLMSDDITLLVLTSDDITLLSDDITLLVQMSDGIILLADDITLLSDDITSYLTMLQHTDSVIDFEPSPPKAATLTLVLVQLGAVEFLPFARPERGPRGAPQTQLPVIGREEISACDHCTVCPSSCCALSMGDISDVLWPWVL
ncbi:hypothetical protein BaRGS_00017128 [Batillaria attramentaria]|uniref:Uncharacterized protein n=1 Tax=Batillaria attramentaria TaxID=370345 RepID=A0ABD0KWX8_9CAEN